MFVCSPGFLSFDGGIPGKNYAFLIYQIVWKGRNIDAVHWNRPGHLSGQASFTE